MKTPKWLPLLAPKGLIWEINNEPAPCIYLTFDDGPHPLATPFVLDQLNSYQAKASFFCIGKNIVENPEIVNRILTEGHSIGHHTHNHFNGWQTDTSQYLNNY
ncbi:MAG: polysaccharide deacetylase family protein, partial [Bacteroidetes bacterium]|nr:polysaccharide deacetylase family protein [Bacteroidota bacterium]